MQAKHTYLIVNLPKGTQMRSSTTNVLYCIYVRYLTRLGYVYFMDILPLCLLKLWLFLAYVVSFVSLAASVGLLIQDALLPEGPSAWTGTAGVLQCVFVLISGLVYWTSHSE
ncbi:hypothetical protein HanPI659440_Chr11g0406371 [Helianthus annuus]|nr:hypothetical protein HanPI659440_Chr11g0406371 [Helianthus annuus]